jgi:hypothetical protein
VIGEHYSVQKFGVTIFEAEATEVPIDWGLDDLVFARVRAATNNDPSVHRIAYPRGAFDPFYHAKAIFIPDAAETLPVIVKGFTANANCDRYLVATTSASASAALRERTRALITDRLDQGLPGYLKED